MSARESKKSDRVKAFQDGDLVTTTFAYRTEAERAKFDRMQQNRLNFDAYHLRQDWSYKREGQSREYLPKMSMAVEQATNFLQQGLTDLNNWFKVEPEEGITEDALFLKSSEIQRILTRQLEKNNFYNFAGNSFRLGLIGSLMIVKVHGRYVPKYKYVYKEDLDFKKGSFRPHIIKKEDKVWQLKLETVRQEDFFPDPTGRGMYVLQDIYMDYYEVEQLTKGPEAIYDKDMVQQLRGIGYTNEGTEKEYRKARETAQNMTNPGRRSKIKITECWGNVVNSNGELVYENVTWSIANDRFVIRKPTPNPFWHGYNPFVAVPIIDVPNSVWGKALMDAPAMLNRAINEMFNLTLDGGMMSVHGIKQIRSAWLEDESQIAEGISPGTTLRVNSMCPPGASVLERVDTSSTPQDAIAILNLLNQEHNTAAITSDLRMGVTPFRQVKATEVVESSQSMSNMFAGMAKQLETGFMNQILEKSWKLCAQHLKDMDEDEIKSIIGGKRGAIITQATKEQLFVETVQGCKFRVFGISATLNKQKEFTKIQALLQTVAGNPILMQEFAKEHSFSKLLIEIIRSLDIDEYKIKADEQEGGNLNEQQPQQPPVGQNPGPDMQSQIPQAGSQAGQSAMKPESNIPTEHFPPSRATPKGGVNI